MKPATFYHAIAVPHPEIPRGYWARYGAVGQAPEWVTDLSGNRRVFGNKEDAELAGYRALMSRMNGVWVPAKTRRAAPAAFKQNVNDADRVFARFKKPATKGE